MKMIRILFFATASLTTTVAAPAQETIDGSNVEAILDIARGYGKAITEHDAGEDPLITGRLDGLIYQIYFLNCTDNQDCEDVNFYMGFSALTPSLETVNDWNRSKRFSRAYIGEDGTPNVEMDLDLAVPVSVEYMRSVFDLWQLVSTQFAEHIGYIETE
ncbi:hypothetical protein GCM10007989_04420 [Devosia pacifica]|uniref:Sensory transduction regulator n=1 Tax=Devosia pacifica TaxID=1335967 RepID=A0A918RU74_9HYPH|nr:YbjN domain-containing protein [Devosia pacifica]GHA12983.1 hypothetical protein GCM10007989_04420 [Devosia pacifica]